MRQEALPAVGRSGGVLKDLYQNKWAWQQKQVYPLLWIHTRALWAVFFVVHFYATCQNFLFMLSPFLQQRAKES